jgi:hypothetical protein
MRVKGYGLAAALLCGLFILAAASDAFGQGPRGGGPGGRPPGGPGIGFPQGGPPPDGGPRRGGEQGPPPPRRGDGPPPFGPRADFLSSEMRFGDRLVKGVPYSAQFVTEATQTLGDGTHVTRKSTGAVYRSTDGRTRRELTINSIGPVAVEGGPSQLVIINDFAAHAHYALDVNNHTARKLPLGDPPPASEPPPAGPEAADGSVKTEQLGRQIIEGVEAEGTRSTVTIPVGKVGNDRPIEIVSERWYSPELQVVVLSKHSDPFAGENVYRLTNITRGEPAASLFEVPADYAVESGPPPRQPKRPRQ